MSEKTANDLFERFAKRLAIAHNINPAVDKALLSQIFWHVATYYNNKDDNEERSKVLDIITTTIPIFLLQDKDKIKKELDRFFNLSYTKQLDISDINVYDMLVFKDACGSIYQDCVQAITKDALHNIHMIRCNNTKVFFKNSGFLSAWYIDNDAIETRGDLVEVWTRLDENTYTCLWRK